MAKYFKHFILLTFAFFMLTSCQEGGEAGDLLGQWRKADTDSKYVAFSGSIAVLRSTTGGYLEREVYGNFQRQGDSLFIQCYSIKGERADTVAVEEDFEFKPFNNIRVKIETLSGNVLVLSKEGKKWNFTKY